MVGPATNWAGNVRFSAGQVHRPESVDQVRRLVADGSRVRALGTGHSFSTIADSPGELISLAGLPAGMVLDPEASTVSVGAGVRYGELASWLHERRYALHNLGSLPHISVAGACSTGTHGSGDRNGGLGTAVAALDLVTADGDVTTLTRGDHHLDAAVVGLGALGIITRLTLDVQPTFEVRQYVYEQLGWDEVTGQLAEIFASGYSVSVFTDWGDPPASQIWAKLRADQPTPDLPGRPADGPRHPLAGHPTENCTAQLGLPGHWHERLPHFRLEFTPSSGVELQSEYLVPRESAADALAAVREIAHLVAPVLQVSELRSIAADELWLSPSYQRASIAIHFTWIADGSAVAPVVAAVEQQLAPFNARPHWGKLFSLPPGTLRARYPRAVDFQRLRAIWDPAGKFANNMVDRYLPAS